MTLRAAASRAISLFTRGRRERELDEELRFHLERATEDNIRAGMNARDARDAALRAFGGLDRVKEEYRDRRGLPWLETLVRDFAFAGRTLRRSPGYSVTAIAVLALAIGANTAMFSVMEALLFRPLPYPEPEQLVMLWSENPAQGIREGRNAYRDVEEWRSRARSFSGIAVMDPVSVTLTSSTDALQVPVARASANLFPLLGVRPQLGRTFTEEEAGRRERVAVISHRLWQSRFGASPGVIGSRIDLDGAASKVIGVLPADFDLATLNADVWEPNSLFPDWEQRRSVRGGDTWFAIGRMIPGVSVAQAQSEMSGIARGLDDQLPALGRRRGITLVPLAMQFTGARTRSALWMLAGAVFLVLLIAATNVAGLTIARSTARAREVAVRAALGASRARIVQQLLAESLTLSTIAGLLGFAVAHGIVRAVVAAAPGRLAAARVQLDSGVLFAAAALTLLTGILLGLAPAFVLARRSIRLESARTVAGSASARSLRRLLVAAEFALAIVLLSGAGLLMRSLWSAERVDPGFRPQRVLSVQLASPAFPGPQQRLAFFRQVIEKIRALPGVESAGIIDDLFIGGNAEQLLTAEADEHAEGTRLRFRRDAISDTFFEAAGAALVRGRFFTAADGPDAPRVAIVNQALAQSLWPNADPTGRRFAIGAATATRTWFSVVGVVADMRRQGLEREPIPQMFEPLAQNPSRLVTMIVRGTGRDPLRLVSAVETAVRAIDRRAPVYGITTLEERLSQYLAQRRFATSLLMAFAGVALLLAAIGIYGLIQYSIATRTHEIGIRMAVGAQNGQIFGMFLIEGLQLSAAGLTAGLAIALWLDRAAAGLLFAVSATDPLTYATVSVLLLATSLVSTLVPARRATRLELASALRVE